MHRDFGLTRINYIQKHKILMSAGCKIQFGGQFVDKILRRSEILAN